MIEILNICLHQNSIVIKFFKILKIREIFCESPRIIFVLFYDVHKENMFTINLGDSSKARKKGAKRLEFLVLLNLYINLACLSVCLFVCLYPINVKTAEPIGPKLFVGHLGTLDKVYE